MSSKRGNPVDQAAGRKVLSQSVVHPVADGANTDKQPSTGKLRIPQNKSKTLNQKVGNPSDGARRMPGK